MDDDVDGASVVVHSPPLDPYQLPVGGISAEHPIETGGQRWRLIAFPTAAFLQPLRTRQPLLLGSTAAIAWMLLAGLVAISRTRTRDRVYGAVRDFRRDQVQLDDVTIVVCKREPFGGGTIEVPVVHDGTSTRLEVC